MAIITTRTRYIYSYAQVSDETKTRKIESFGVIKAPNISVQDVSFCAPFDSTEFDCVIWEELSRPVIVRKMRDNRRNLDETYGFEKAQPEEEIIRAIVHNVNAKDGKLIDSGFANVGDFTLRFKKDADVRSRDTVYDPIFKTTYDLVNWPLDSYVKTNHLWKQFVGKLQ